LKRSPKANGRDIVLDAMMIIRFCFTILLLISAFAGSTQAQMLESLIMMDQTAKLGPDVLGSAPKGHRVALVIGNSRYATIDTLSNPRNDATAIAAAFRKAEFAEVIEAHDATAAEMTAMLAMFKRKAAEADWAVVYFAGHGMEMNGDNYLIAVDATVTSEQELQQFSVSLGNVIDSIQGTRKLGLVILDACRNNPFIKAFQEGRAASRSQAGGSHAAPISPGLGAVVPPTGVMVAYASKHGTVASDGEGKHSPYTAALLDKLTQPGLELNDVFRRVRDQVFAASGGQQQPYTYDSLPAGRFYFN
jgi:uncharacterized caspase-like protein